MTKKKEKPVKKVKEPKTKEPMVKKPTVKERISLVVDKYDDKEELKTQLFDLVQRILYPDQFCPDCNDRLFYGPNGWSCPNCGYTRPADVPITQKSPDQPMKRPSEDGVPPEVDKAINEANKNMQEPRRVAAPSKKGQKIRDLVDKMDTGNTKPTPADEANVRKDPNASTHINWV